MKSKPLHTLKKAAVGLSFAVLLGSFMSSCSQKLAGITHTGKMQYAQASQKNTQIQTAPSASVQQKAAEQQADLVKPQDNQPVISSTPAHESPVAETPARKIKTHRLFAHSTAPVAKKVASTLKQQLAFAPLKNRSVLSQKTTSFHGNVRTGIIFLVVGLLIYILTIIPVIGFIFWIIGTIFIVLGALYLIFALLDM